MRAYDQGAHFRVTADIVDLHDFRSKWPGSGLGSVHAVSAVFEKKNGDLVDFTVNGHGTSKYDGGALTALLDDMSGFGRLSGKNGPRSNPAPKRASKKTASRSKAASMAKRSKSPRKPTARKPARKPSSCRSNPTTKSIWRKRQVVLPAELVNKVDSWHGGQHTATYALASTGRNYLVSLSMIDAAITELRGVLRSVTRKSDRRELRNAIVDLETTRHYWRENDAESAGMDMAEDEYEFDRQNYGMSAEEEAEIKV